MGQVVHLLEIDKPHRKLSAVGPTITSEPSTPTMQALPLPSAPPVAYLPL